MIFWVNSFKKPCTAGVMPTTCLQVQRNEFKEGGWQQFYSPIEGFEFETGYRYKLEVEETRLPAGQVPADGSSIRYRLIRVLEKTADPQVLINDSWWLEHMEGVTELPAQRPYLELQVNNLQFLGHDGCEAFRGSFRLEDGGRLQFSGLPAQGTGCTQRPVSRQFRAAVQAARTYKREQLRLFLYDETGKELLRFRKGD